MSLSRRQFLSLTTGTVLAGALPPVAAGHADAAETCKAVVFDAFPIFDPRPTSRVAEGLFPGAGVNLMNVWRTRQFDYQWWRALSNKYVDFWQATADSLTFAAKQNGLHMTDQARDELMGTYSNLTVWPDVPESLRLLHAAGIRLGILSNMTKEMLEAGLAGARLGGLFEHVLSTDQIKTYKPAPSAYQLAADAFALPRQEILFVPFAGWDVAGAKWFGYPAFWVNRLGSPAEELGVIPDGAGKDLQALTAFVLRSAKPDERTNARKSAAPDGFACASASLHGRRS
jgi:2-haloacid dehalogenase